MKNIKFQQPKYVLPLIALPFLFMFFYTYKSFGGKKQEESDRLALETAATSNQLNSTIPQPDKSVTNENIQDKMAAFKEAYSKQTDASAVRALEPDEDAGSRLKSLYSDIEIRQIDSIQATIKARQRENELPISEKRSTYRASSSASTKVRGHQSESDQRLSSAMERLERSNRTRPNDPDEEYAKQMRLFKDQMTFMDSIQDAKDPDHKAKRIVPVEPPVKPMPVKKAGSLTLGHFNTITAKKTDHFIQAIIDENLKGYAGSGIRIRLLDDIQVGEHLIPKGTYLFGIISGFQLQRVEISIVSIMLGKEILPVEIKVYDNDGMLGLYVPDSHFREFTKNLGANSSQGITYQSDGESAKIVTGLVQKLFTSTTTAASQLIKKNKVTLKYNTQVYLVSKEEK